MRTFILLALLSIFALSAFGKVTIQQRIALIQTSKAKQERINQVLNLLEDLKQSTVQNLADVRAAWEIRRPELENLVQIALDNANAKQNRCDGIQNVIDELNGRVAQTQADIDSAQNVIDTNTRNIQERNDQRCQQNLLFVNRLKENLQAVKLLNFIRAVLQNDEFRQHIDTQRELLQLGEKNDFAFIQKAVRSKDPYQMFSALHIFIQHKSSLKQDDVADDNLNQILALKDRTAEEVGTGHIDNDQDELELPTFDHDDWSTDTLIAYATQAVDSLIAVIQMSSASLSASEIEAIGNLILFVGAAEDEIEKQNVLLVQLNQHLVDLTNAIAQNTEAEAVCVSEHDALVVLYNDAVELLETETETFNNKVASLESDIALFEEAIELYKNSVVGSAVEYQARVDDYVEDKDFDDQTFENRATNTDIDQFEATNPNVAANANVDVSASA